MDIQPPEHETRVAILRGWAAERGVTLPRQIAELIAVRAKAHVREMEGVFNQMIAASQYHGQMLTMDIASSILDGYHRPRHRVTLGQVLDMTARHHGLTVDDLIGPRRTGAINQARQIAMYLAREITLASLPQIGDAFGGRKHSTVLHSCNKVAEEIEHDPMLRTIVKDIHDRLTKGG
jgi:chromosomal replication initiator protein